MPEMTAEQIAEYEQLKAAQGAQAGAPSVAATPAAIPSAPAGASGFGTQPPVAQGAGFGASAAPACGVVSLSVPVTITSPDGSQDVGCYIALAPEAARDPVGAIQALAQAGWKIRTWQPKGQGFGGGYGSRGQGNSRRW